MNNPNANKSNPQKTIVIEKLENKIKIPITSSNHALAWHCLRLAGIDDNFPNLGKLYECNLNKK